MQADRNPTLGGLLAETDDEASAGAADKTEAAADGGDTLEAREWPICDLGPRLGPSRRRVSVSRPVGVEADYAAAEDCSGIPLSLLNDDRRLRVVLPALITGTGVNLDPIIQSIFALPVTGMLASLPRVSSGTCSTETITTNLTADAKAKGDDMDAAAAEITTNTTTPHRISAG
ncbi:MAG: hypothetical protein F4Y27_10780 [Acidimicrobiaceae bacterium]|nr:hypothetical protein [Acidimicrobiaceae bacterium]MYG56693.1 hypothetical protein [Acidimicrobiaceae bacterium]MYK00238.1 hypothetical protein [Acidimicrobiaceae bacterium]